MKLFTRNHALKNNRYFCISMLGKNYGDNIKPLADYISKHENADIIWAFDEFLYDKIECNYKKVKMYSKEYYYYILTSKYVLTNQFLYDILLVKRKGQIYLQTWHGTALKKIGYSANNKNINIKEKIIRNYSIYSMRKVTDIFVSGSHYMTKIYNEAFCYNKQIYEVGTPRNDIFFKKEDVDVEKIKRLFHIPLNNKIILYAPTFRTGHVLKYYDINLKKLKEVLSVILGGEFSIMLRFHPSMMEISNKLNKTDSDISIADASTYPDMQDLLVATDVLVTDYSSTIFDYMYLKRPVIMYVPDRNSYDRGFYLDIDSLPFIIINNNGEIDERIKQFDNKQYENRVDAFLDNIGSVESGNATELTYKLLQCKKNNMKTNVY